MFAIQPAACHVREHISPACWQMLLCRTSWALHCPAPTLLPHSGWPPCCLLCPHTQQILHTLPAAAGAQQAAWRSVCHAAIIPTISLRHWAHIVVCCTNPPSQGNPLKHVPDMSNAGTSMSTTRKATLGRGMECKVEPLGRGWFNAVATQPPSSQRGTSSSSTHSSTDRRKASPGERQQQQWLVFEVSDSGCGIGEAGLRSLFKDYVQVRTAGRSSCFAPAEPDHCWRQGIESSGHSDLSDLGCQLRPSLCMPAAKGRAAVQLQSRRCASA